MTGILVVGLFANLASQHNLLQTKGKGLKLTASLPSSNLPVDRRIPLHPLTAEPAVVKVQRGLRLIHRNHVAGTVDAHEGKVATGLDLAVLLLIQSQGIEVDGIERALAGPLEGLSPSMVSKPVANIVGIAGIDEHGHLLDELGHELVVGLEPVTSKEEVPVDVKVAAVVALDLDAERIHDILLVQVLRDPAKSRVAEVAAVLALAADVVDVATGPLVRADEVVVTVNAGRHASPDAVRLVAALDEALAVGKSVIHRPARRLVQDSWVATLTARHRAVVCVLRESIRQTVADENALEVDVPVLMRHDLRGKNGDVMSRVRLACDMEVLLRVFGELVEEEREEGIDVLSSSDSVANRSAAIRIAYVHGLVEKDDGSIVIPRVWVVDDVQVLVDGGRTKLEEETGKGGASRPTVQPQHDGVVLGVISRLEEPYHTQTLEHAGQRRMPRGFLSS